MSESKLNAGILGLGIKTPDKILTNSDLEKIVDTSDEWIIKRTGIKERRIQDDAVPMSELGVCAALEALQEAKLKAEEIELIIVTTETPDYLTPSMSCIIQKRIGAYNAAAFDLNAACSGYVYGLSICQQFIRTGFYKKILLIACEGLSRITDWSDRSTCVLFGDAAAAAVIGPVKDGYGILSTHLGADGGLGPNITIPCCFASEEDIKVRNGSKKMTLWMDGSEVFKFAVRILDYAAREVLKNCSMSLDEIKMIIPHQANIRIIEGAAKRLGVSDDKLFVNVHEFGNTSSASIPLALHQCIKRNAISYGDNIILVGFGGGLTWASALIKWGGI